MSTEQPNKRNKMHGKEVGWFDMYIELESKVKALNLEVEQLKKRVAGIERNESGFRIGGLQ